MNESDEGRFVLMSQYLRKVLQQLKKTKRVPESQTMQTLEPESLQLVET